LTQEARVAFGERQGRASQTGGREGTPLSETISARWRDVWAIERDNAVQLLS